MNAPATLLPSHKTKIVCTIGPASDSVEIMERMLHAGMNIARLNFSHGDFDTHGRNIRNLREASHRSGHRITIMADLSGPKMRIGKLGQEPIELRTDDRFILTTEEIVGDATRTSVSFKRLPDVVQPANILYLNDGIVQLEVERVDGADVRCRVLVGGELRSHKGLNIPGIDLGISAFTDNDRKCLEFALGQGVDAVSQSFVESAADINAVRQAAASLGHHPFIIAKIERSRALANLDAILEASDGVMIARGDLGVEIPIEQIAVIQKQIMLQANRLGKPAITATQMLESMTLSRIPTRAEATDVANAIIDGTDAVMLSGESAMGKYPVEAVTMLARIAAATEPQLPRRYVREAIHESDKHRTIRPSDLISLGLETMLEYATPMLVVVPTRSGETARRIARFKLPVWIAAVSSQESTCRHLQFSYGVLPIQEAKLPDDWNQYVRARLVSAGVKEGTVMLVEGPSSRRPDANHRIELLDMGRLTRS
jgi:pyruvate kinase